MRHNDAKLVRRATLQTVRHLPDLAGTDQTILVAAGMGRVEPDHEEFVILENRLQIAAEMSAVIAIRLQEANRKVVEREIVIAWYDQRMGNAIPLEALHECPRGSKLAVPGALCDVTGEDQQVRAELLDVGLQCRHDRRLLGAEVRVGDLQQGGRHRRFEIRG